MHQDIQDYPDTFHYERAKRLNVSARSIGHALKRLGVTRKKTLFHPKRDEEKRLAFCNKIEGYMKEGRNIVSPDESGFAVDPVRRHGYSSRG